MLWGFPEGGDLRIHDQSVIAFLHAAFPPNSQAISLFAYWLIEEKVPEALSFRWARQSGELLM